MGDGAGGPGVSGASPTASSLTSVAMSSSESPMEATDTSLRHEGVVVVVGDQQHVCPGEGQGRDEGVGSGAQWGKGWGEKGGAGRERTVAQRPREGPEEKEKWWWGHGRGCGGGTGGEGETNTGEKKEVKGRRKAVRKGVKGRQELTQVGSKVKQEEKGTVQVEGGDRGERGKVGEEEEGFALRCCLQGCQGQQGPLTGLTQQLWLLCWTGSGRRCGNSSQPSAGRSPGTFSRRSGVGEVGEGQVGRKRTNQRRGGGQGRKAPMASGRETGGRLGLKGKE